MAEIYVFRPKAELDADENLQEFIRNCKNNLSVFGDDLPFDEYVWDVTDQIKAKGKNHRVRIVFSDWDTVSLPNATSISEPFCSFAKAYVRYQHPHRKVIDIGIRVSALRAIDKALKDNHKSSPVEIDAHILNCAANLITEKFSPERAYRLGQQVELIGKFIDKNRFSVGELRWKNNIKRPGGTQQIGKEFDERREEKLPSAYALEALAHAYVIAEESEDILITSIAAIMCATPDRISEILTLPFDCEYEVQLPDGKRDYGLRYWPAKGAAPMIKRAIPSMTDLLKEAISRIKKQTQGARELARWYEIHPTTLYLPKHLEHFRGSLLSTAQASEVIFGVPHYAINAKNWLVQRKAAFQNGKILFSDMEEIIISCLPRGFPYLDKSTGLKYSEALCVIYANQLHQAKFTQICSIEAMGHGQIEYGLGGGIEHGKSSVFSRLKILGDDNAEIKINTHQFRHYLNTLAMQGGLNELDIAKWSGRKDVRQNRAYDHVSIEDKLALIRDAVGDPSKMFGPLAVLPKGPMIARDEFARLKVTAAHTTEFGYCIHDYVMSPCQRHMDCLNCNELVCIKGDGVREKNLRRQQQETRTLIEVAENDEEAGMYGANRWVVHQKRTLQRLDELCQILDNPNIQLGAVIQLNDTSVDSLPATVASAQKINFPAETNSDVAQERYDNIYDVLKLTLEM